MQVLKTVLELQMFKHGKLDLACSLLSSGGRIYCTCRETN